MKEYIVHCGKKEKETEYRRRKDITSSNKK